MMRNEEQLRRIEDGRRAVRVEMESDAILVARVARTPRSR